MFEDKFRSHAKEIHEISAKIADYSDAKLGMLFLSNTFLLALARASDEPLKITKSLELAHEAIIQEGRRRGLKLKDKPT